eukprot:363403-Chlamydomonas_euryale.AAC.7
MQARCANARSNARVCVERMQDLLALLRQTLPRGLSSKPLTMRVRQWKLTPASGAPRSLLISFTAPSSSPPSAASLCSDGRAPRSGEARCALGAYALRRSVKACQASQCRCMGVHWNGNACSHRLHREHRACSHRLCPSLAPALALPVTPPVFAVHPVFGAYSTCGACRSKLPSTVPVELCLAAPPCLRRMPCQDLACASSVPAPRRGCALARAHRSNCAPSLPMRCGVLLYHPTLWECFSEARVVWGGAAGY